MKQPINLTSISRSQWDNMCQQVPEEKRYEHVYVVAEFGKSARVQAWMPRPALVRQGDTVVHLVVEVPEWVECHQIGYNATLTQYRDWAGGDPQLVLCQGETPLLLTLGTNEPILVPQQILLESKHDVFVCPVVAYDTDPYWWMSVAEYAARMAGSNETFDIDHAGQLVLTFGTDDRDDYCQAIISRDGEYGIAWVYQMPQEWIFTSQNTGKSEPNVKEINITALAEEINFQRMNIMHEYLQHRG